MNKKIGKFFFIVIFFVNGSIVGMDMQQKLCERWKPDKDICFDRMGKASEKRKTTVYVNEDGKLCGKFDGATHRVTTYFDDDTSYENDFTQLYAILETPRPTRYLRDGKIYDRDNKVIANISIKAMHEKSKHEESKKKRCVIS